MPKFGEAERAMLQQKLLTEGEQLFSRYGLKKVTVDDLTRAAGIAKGSFYSFYTSKEHLYLEIADGLQRQMWTGLEQFLQKNRSLSPVVLMKQAFLWMFSHMETYPLLRQTDRETVEYLFRKLPPEIIAAHTREDSGELKRLEQYGITFRCSADKAAKIMQALFVSFMNLGDDRAAMELMLDGVLGEIVCHEAD